MATLFVTNRNQNELARHLKHDGVRVGEIIAYRAWRVIEPGWLRSGDNRLHSVLIKDYVWHPDEPASGDVRTHGIYSCRDVIRSKEEYWYSVGWASLLFGKVKIWAKSWNTKRATAPNLAKSSAWITAIQSFWRSSGKSTK